MANKYNDKSKWVELDDSRFDLVTPLYSSAQFLPGDLYGNYYKRYINNEWIYRFEINVFVIGDLNKKPGEKEYFFIKQKQCLDWGPFILEKVQGFVVRNNKILGAQCVFEENKGKNVRKVLFPYY